MLTWTIDPEALSNLREGVRAKLEELRRTKPRPPVPAPYYDEIFFEGVRRLNGGCMMPWTASPDVLGYWTCEGPPGSGMVAWVRLSRLFWQWGFRRGQVRLTVGYEDTRLAAQERAGAVLDSQSARGAGVADD